MCTGLELLFGLGAIGGTVASVAAAGGGAAPPQSMPAIAAPDGRAPGATVRVGTGQDEGTNTEENAPGAPKKYTRRTEGQALAALGRSGLAL